MWIGIAAGAWRPEQAAAEGWGGWMGGVGWGGVNILLDLLLPYLNTFVTMPFRHDVL